jgi:ubiquitin
VTYHWACLSKDRQRFVDLRTATILGNLTDAKRQELEDDLEQDIRDATREMTILTRNQRIHAQIQTRKRRTWAKAKVKAKEARRAAHRANLAKHDALDADKKALRKAINRRVNMAKKVKAKAQRAREREAQAGSTVLKEGRAAMWAAETGLVLPETLGKKERYKRGKLRARKRSDSNPGGGKGPRILGRFVLAPKHVEEEDDPESAGTGGDREIASVALIRFKATGNTTAMQELQGRRCNGQRCCEFL